MTFATSNDLLTGVPVPVLGFADMQGVATHEFGHFAGLGHSLVDSQTSATGSLTPTMFPIAQVETFSATVTDPDGQCDPSRWSSQTVSGGGSFGGILGRSAQTLEPDDALAILEGYAGTGFVVIGGDPGSISGTVSRHNGTSLVGEPGVHVVAVRRTNPDGVRVGTLSFSGGQYQINNLQPGQYVVYIESADQDPAGIGGAGSGFYFPDPFAVPNFIFLGQTGCVIPAPQVPIEFFDGAEGHLETDNMKVGVVTVVTGQNTTADFVVNNQTFDELTVRDAASTAHFSPRGMIVTPANGVFPVVRFRIQSQLANQPVVLFLDFQRTVNLANGQLRQVLGGSQPTVPGSLTANTGATGTAIIDLPLTSALGFRNIFAQAMVGPATAPHWTNAVNVWVTNP